jgi:hypothetical protein
MCMLLVMVERKHSRGIAELLAHVNMYISSQYQKEANHCTWLINQIWWCKIAIPPKTSQVKDNDPSLPRWSTSLQTSYIHVPQEFEVLCPEHLHYSYAKEASCSSNFSTKVPSGLPKELRMQHSVTNSVNECRLVVEIVDRWVDVPAIDMVIDSFPA